MRELFETRYLVRQRGGPLERRISGRKPHAFHLFRESLSGFCLRGLGRLVSPADSVFVDRRAADTLVRTRLPIAPILDLTLPIDCQHATGDVNQDTLGEDAYREQ